MSLRVTTSAKSEDTERLALVEKARYLHTQIHRKKELVLGLEHDPAPANPGAQGGALHGAHGGHLIVAFHEQVRDAFVLHSGLAHREQTREFSDICAGDEQCEEAVHEP